MIADASPLIVFAKAGRLELLAAVVGSVEVPAEVRAECVDLAPELPDAALLRDAFEEGWLVVADAPVRELARVRRRHPHLGLGETAALALARARGGVLLVDDRAARRAAKLEGVRPVGCLGVLAAAIRQELLNPEEAHRAFSDLLEAGLWVSGTVADRFWQSV